jgi:hypothetical protein
MEVAMAQGRKTEPEPTGGKRCSCCKRVKPLGQFCKDRSQDDGKHSRCRVCRAAVSAADRGTERYKAWIKAYRARPEVKMQRKKAAQRLQAQRADAKVRYRQTPRGKVVEARADARRRLRVAEASVAAALAQIARCDATIARMDAAKRRREAS